MVFWWKIDNFRWTCLFASCGTTVNIKTRIRDSILCRFVMYIFYLLLSIDYWSPTCSFKWISFNHIFALFQQQQQHQQNVCVWIIHCFLWIPFSIVKLMSHNSYSVLLQKSKSKKMQKKKKNRKNKERKNGKLTTFKCRLFVLILFSCLFYVFFFCLFCYYVSVLYICVLYSN